MKVLMVCLGNICRSPLAEGILQEKIREKNLPWTVDSAGTGHWHIGNPPDPRSIAVANKYGIDIRTQRGRQLRLDDLDRFDLILAMDESNYQNILRFAQTPEQSAKVRMIMDYVHPGQRVSVPDPYWDNDGFEAVYQMLEEACERLVSGFVK